MFSLFIRICTLLFHNCRPVVNAYEVLPELTTPSMLGRANRTRELRFFTAFFSLVPRQRWFPYVLLPARVAAVLSTITLVVIGPLIS